MKTVRMSCSHALIKYLTMQKILINEKKESLFPGAFGIYGHGNVACIGQAMEEYQNELPGYRGCLLYTSPSPRDRTRSRMPSSA